MKRAMLLLVPVVLFSISAPSMAQNLEVGGGWAHATGDFGLDGFNADIDYWFTPRVSGVLSYDNVWDTSNIGTFELTSIGQIAIKSHLQNYLVGPRIALATKRIKKYEFMPFAEIQIGGTHLHSEVQEASTGSKQVASGDGFSWMLGGGGDYVVSPHWAARANLGFLRTHLANSGQSRLRLVIGFVYSFESRNR
jgi:hypothetical protein